MQIISFDAPSSKDIHLSRISKLCKDRPTQCFTLLTKKQGTAAAIVLESMKDFGQTGPEHLKRLAHVAKHKKVEKSGQQISSSGLGWTSSGAATRPTHGSFVPSNNSHSVVVEETKRRWDSNMMTMTTTEEPSNKRHQRGTFIDAHSTLHIEASLDAPRVFKPGDEIPSSDDEEQEDSKVDARPSLLNLNKLKQRSVQSQIAERMRNVMLQEKTQPSNSDNKKKSNWD